MSKKNTLIEKAIAAGLGTEEFLKGVAVENLEKMVAAIEERDGEIRVLQAGTKEKSGKNPNVTTVSDLIRAGKLRSVNGAIPEDKFSDELPAEPAKEPGESNEEKDKA